MKSNFFTCSLNKLMAKMERIDFLINACVVLARQVYVIDETLFNRFFYLLV